MPNSLSNLTITSVDLVEAGANQEANIEIIKRKDQDMAEKPEIQEVIQTLVKSLTEINNSTEFNDIQKNSMLEESFIQAVSDLNSKLAKSETETTEEVEAEVETEPVEETEVEAEVETEVEAEEDVEKARKRADEIIKGFQQQIENVQKKNDELVKKLELKELEEQAQKYQAIGEDPAELAKKLYSFKQSGETLYNDYLDVLNKSLTIQEETGVFKEIGSSQSYEDSSEFENVLKSYTDKGVNAYAAFEQIAIDHPELLAEYDKNYRG